jgi:hypothetical protein
MNASLFAYVYIILVVSDLLSIPLAIYRKDDRAGTFIAVLPFLLIGLSCELYIEPRLYILGFGW